MPRQIVTREFIRREQETIHPADASAGRPILQDVDGYTSKVVKLIPTEVVALYLFLSGIIAAARPAEADRGPVLTFVFGALLVLTAPYLRRVAGVRNRLQVGISTVAFGVWVFSLGGPFVYLLQLAGFSYDQLWGAILLGLYTFIVPIFDKSYTGPSAV